MYIATTILNAHNDITKCNLIMSNTLTIIVSVRNWNAAQRLIAKGAVKYRPTFRIGNVVVVGKGYKSASLSSQ